MLWESTVAQGESRMENVLNHKPLLPMKLQFFAEGDGGGSGSVEGASVGWGDPANNPLLTDNNPPASGVEQPVVPGTVDQPGQPSQTQPQLIEFGGRQIDPNDPNAWKTVQHDYSELNRTFQQTNQRLKDMEQQNQAFQTMLQMMQNGQMPYQQPQQPAAPQGPTPEETQQFIEQYNEKFYENPIEANKMLLESDFLKPMLQKMVEQFVAPVIQPIQQEKQWGQAVQDIRSKFQDFDNYKDAIAQVVQNNPLAKQLANNPSVEALESLYLMAKGQTSGQQQQQVITDPEQLLNDQNFRNQIMQNTDIRNAIIQSYISDKSQTNQQIPNVMGNQAGGHPPAVPPDKPKSLREATQGLLKHWGINN